VERSLPDFFHSRAQSRLIQFLGQFEKTPGVYACAELRMRLREGLVLIPDICVYISEPTKVPTTPPLIAIEILSDDDRLTKVLQKLEEYRTWGVAHVWLVDPQGKHMYIWTGALTEVTAFPIPEFNASILPNDLFLSTA